ncbi:MAG: hypothetical protein L0271_25985 [Gemmatimonadetes bacterium]|nr:hypothetical protein [Gemmatimonadota bacterium]
MRFRALPFRRPRLEPAAWVYLLLIAAIGCAEPARESAEPAEPEISARDRVLLASAKVALPPDGVDPATLPDASSAGAIELQRFCTTCHALPSPAMHAPSDWPAVLRRMWLRMGLVDPSYGVPIPEVGDRLVLLRYLMDNGLQVSATTLPDLPGRQMFEETCNRCHALPDPRQHSPVDWFVVVERMARHSRDLLRDDWTADEIREMVLFLERAST